MNVSLTIATQKQTVSTALRICIIVGVLLNLINQGEAIFGLRIAEINFAKMLLTFVVPYGVSTYSTVKAKTLIKPGIPSPDDIVLNCGSCKKETIEVEKAHIIPKCTNCEERTKWKIVSYGN